jgi:CHAT domain-containing protein/uncharacterized protein HemY
VQHCLIPRFLLLALVALTIVPLSGSTGSVGAAPRDQSDPATQCAEGVSLFEEGKDAEALPLLEAGFAAEELATFANPDDLGHCALALGQLRNDTGNRSGALEAYAVALEVFRRSGNRQVEGSTLTNIGLVYRNQGQYAEALEAYQQALALAREVGDRHSEGITLNNIGTVHHTQGRYVEALEALQQALALLREVGDRPGEGSTLNNVGGVYLLRGRYAEALEAFQQALALAREVGDRHSEGITLNNIGEVYLYQGRYAEALEAYQQALAHLRAVGDRRNEDSPLNNIGEVYRNQGRYAEALEAFQQALALAREVGDRPDEGSTLNNIGLVYEAQERNAEALEAYQQALALLHEVGDRHSEGTTLNNIGSLYLDQGRYVEALEAFQQALAIRGKVGDRPGEGSTLNNIGQVYHAQGRYDEALAHYAQAMDVLEAVRATAGSEQGRASFIAQHAGLYERAAALYHQQGQDEQAFLTSERGRSRAFLDSLATGYVQLNDEAASDLLERERDAYAVRQAAQNALSQARATSPPETALVTDLEKQLVVAEQAHTDALDAIAQRGGQLAALVPSRTKGVLDRSSVQQLLDPQTTLVAYEVLEDQALVFIITHDSFRTIGLDIGIQDLFAQISALLAFPNLNEAHPASAVQLYSWLIAPIKQHLSMPHLAIVPHSVLHYLPFAALTDGARYLVDDYALTTLPSASALRFIKDNIHRTSGLPLIVGNPTVPKLAPLTFAEREAHAITRLYGVDPLLGADATETALRAGAPQAVILHLAAHGSYNPANPLASVIALAPDGADDGQLAVSEIYGLNLHVADLVVLSACETQLGDLSGGDEVVGLTRAFFFAGTPSVIATLWSVDDEATALLMERFYTHLRTGMGKAAALRQAQLDVRANYPNPYYWSGFVLSGDGGRLNVRIRPTIAPWLMALTGAALLICWVGCVYVRRKQLSTGTILGYTNNQPMYVMAPRFAASARRFALWGMLGIPALAVITIAIGWFFEVW